MPMTTSQAPTEARTMFTQGEVAYLKSQLLARMATADSEAQPDVAPVGFEFDGTHFYVSGVNVEKTFKYRNVQANPRVSLVVDDLVSTRPWHVRGVKIHGVAEVVTQEGYAGPGTYIRIKPRRKWSWGIDGL
jgi:pyridoxamine 5'-phosphate oxidase family protein